MDKRELKALLMEAENFKTSIVWRYIEEFLRRNLELTHMSIEETDTNEVLHYYRGVASTVRWLMNLPSIVISNIEEKLRDEDE